MTRGVAVLGGGAWGTAIAVHLARSGIGVRLWIREAEVVEEILTRRENRAFLPGVRIPDDVLPVSDLETVGSKPELVVAAIPSPYARDVYRRVASVFVEDVPVVVATKGVEEETLALPLDVVRDVLGSERGVAVLSGPSFAGEVARGIPTAVVVASADMTLAARVQERVSRQNLRVYTNRDEIGVQVAGALKNVIAIAAGVVDGLELGLNSRAALVTRGLAEITRLGVALGGRPSTFSGLAGIGDLVLTCTGALSRNRAVGQALGRGESLEDILARTPAVAEGVRTTRSARALARREGVEMPIVDEMHRILYESAAPREALSRLMSRPLTAEDHHHRESAE